MGETDFEDIGVMDLRRGLTEDREKRWGPEALLGRGRALLRLGMRPDAVATLEQLIDETAARDPRRSHSNRETHKARHDLRRFIRERPDEVAATIGRLLVLARPA